MRSDVPAVPKVTVLMTLYNKGAFVEAAVRSVLASTFKDFELLVVDDASTDVGLGIVRGIGDPRIRVLECDRNTGRAAAANRGYDAARGEYVAVLDADDLMEPSRLALQVPFMDANPDIGVCGGWMQAFGDQDTLLRTPPTDEEARGIMLFGVPALYPTCMFRRSMLEAHHLRCDPAWLSPGMDYLFLLDIGAHARFANLQQVVARYRWGQQNMRHGRDPVKDARTLYRAVLDRVGLSPSPEEVDLHLYLLELERPLPNAGAVRALFSWKEKLLHAHRGRSLFPGSSFEAQVQHRWDTLFHALVRKDASAALAHMRCSGRVRERAGYLMIFTLRRWLGLPLDR